MHHNPLNSCLRSFDKEYAIISLSVRFVLARIHLPIDSCNKNVKTSDLIAIEVSVKIWDSGNGT